MNNDCTTTSTTVPCVVLDFGSSCLRAGFGGDDQPRYVVSYSTSECYDNDTPIREGRVIDPARLARSAAVAVEALSNENRTVTTEAAAVISVGSLTRETLPYAAKLRDLLEQLLTETSITKCQIVSSSLAALYGVSRDTGLHIDIALNCCRITPVAESEVLPAACRTIFPQGGLDVTKRLHLFLELANHNVDPHTAELLKRKACFVAPEFSSCRKMQKSATCYHQIYRLPDGRAVPLEEERYASAELTFFANPDHGNLAELVGESLRSSPMDLRKIFLNNVVLGGGGSLLAGMPERLANELPEAYAQAVLRQAVGGARMQASVVSPPRRDQLVFRGASIIATIDAGSKDNNSPWQGLASLQERGLRAFAQGATAL